MNSPWDSLTQRKVLDESCQEGGEGLIKMEDEHEW